MAAMKLLLHEQTSGGYLPAGCLDLAQGKGRRASGGSSTDWWLVALQDIRASDGSALWSSA